jgi:hypothetical protein
MYHTVYTSGERIRSIPQKAGLREDFSTYNFFSFPLTLALSPKGREKFFLSLLGRRKPVFSLFPLPLRGEAKGEG